MIQVINADILTAKEDIICHQVNCMNKIGGGLSGAIIRKYPEVETEYHDYCEFYKNPKELLGNICLVKTYDRKTIANIFGQLTYGRTGFHTNYEALFRGILEVHEYAKVFHRTVAFPWKIGCGLAGGDWNIVQEAIECTFGDWEDKTAFYRLEQKCI